MEVSSIWYFSFCSIMSLLFLSLGLLALDKAAPHPVPDSILLLKIFIPFCMSSPSFYAYLFRPLLDHGVLLQGPKFKMFYLRLLLAFSVQTTFHSNDKLNQTPPHLRLAKIIVGPVLLALSSVVNLWVIVVGFYDSRAVGSFLTGFFGPLLIYPNHTLFWILFANLYFLVGYAKWIFSSAYQFFFDFLVMYWFASICTLTMYVSIHPWFNDLLVTSSNFMSRVYMKRNVIEGLLGLLGVLIVHYFTREKSGALVLALACFSVSWLANVAMNQPTSDLGIFYFLIGACADCAADVFGFHFCTWLVIVFAAVLIIIHGWKIDSISVRYIGLQENVLRKWNNLEQQHDSRNRRSTERLPWLIPS